VSLREDLAEALVANLIALPGIKSAICVTEEPDMHTFSRSQLPLATVRLDRETPKYQTSRFAFWTVRGTVSVYFLAARADYETRETLVKAVKDCIGADPTLGDKCEMVGIANVSGFGQYPLYKEVFEIQLGYERGIANG
jgi:hypothetical protein